MWLCELEDGEDVVVEASIKDCAGMFAAEAAGLDVLTELGGLTTPRVLAVGPRSIMLEALGPTVHSDRESAPDAVRHTSVNSATRRSTVMRDDTLRDK